MGPREDEPHAPDAARGTHRMSPSFNRRTFISIGAASLAATALGTRPRGRSGRIGPWSSPAAMACRPWRRPWSGSRPAPTRSTRRSRAWHIVEADPKDHTRRARAASPTRRGSSSSTRRSCTARPMAAAASPRCGNIMHPAAVARMVMKRTDHCLLVGEGALRFARAHGFPEIDLLTDEARRDLAPLERDQRQGQRLDRPPDVRARPRGPQGSSASASTAPSTARRSTRTATSAA